MLINRHNYEEFFLLYVDNELSAADRKAVEVFVEQNADLEEELVMMMQSVLRPDKNIVFANKELLLQNKPANGLVNESNYEEYFVLYGDNELTNEEKDLVEQFVYKHPQYQAEFELIQQARLLPDTIAYPDINELYRTEKDDKVIPFRWWRIAAAAIVLLFLGVTAWYMTNSDQPKNVEPSVAKTQEVDSNKVKTTRPPVINNEQKNLAATTNDDQKKSDVPRNIKRNTIVTPERTVKEALVKVETPEKENKVVEDLPKPENDIRTASVSEVYANNERPINTNDIVKKIDPGMDLNKDEKLVYYYIDEESSDEQIKLANASINKKPVRGLIRKVKGLFEGNNDDNEPHQENKKGIRIAAFEIGLK